MECLHHGVGCLARESPHRLGALHVVEAAVQAIPALWVHHKLVAGERRVLEVPGVAQGMRAARGHW